MWRLLVSLATCALLMVGCATDNRAPNATPDSPVPSVLVLDGSGSMNQADAPGPRIEAAKNAARRLIEALPDSTQIALQTYGTTTGSTLEEKHASCQDVITLLPMTAMDRAEMRDAIDGITPSGYTPISLALQLAAKQLPASEEPQAIILVSDGEDTCDVPPCETAEQLKQQRPGLTISTVGFKVDGPAADQLSCIADVTGGLFVQADNANQLTARLLATQDVDQAHGSLSATGIHGINLGDKAAEIRAQHADFPEVAHGALEVVAWRDCVFRFIDGTLDAIDPGIHARTIDGITIGSSATDAIGLYGQPIAATDVRDGTLTFTFDADPNHDAAYQISAYFLGPLTGTIKSIVLCRCKPTDNADIPSSTGVTRPANVTDATIRSMTFPAGTCGDDARGWKHDVPITVTNGDGEARTASGEFGGASISGATLVGWIDGDGDGTEDAVVSFNCFGSTFAMCCAGRTSNMMFARVFDFSNSSEPQAVGETIEPGISPVPGRTGGESRRIEHLRVVDSTLITEELLVYPEHADAVGLGHSPYATIEVTHRFSGGGWISTERVIGAQNDVLGGAQQVPVEDYYGKAWSAGDPLTPSPGADMVTFDTPSGNITCSWYLDVTSDPPLNCDISERASPAPARPADCGPGPGWATNYVRLTSQGAQDGVCTGGLQTPWAGRVLPYGSALVAGEFGCRSDESGVTCVHLPSGRGFVLSRKAFRPF